MKLGRDWISSATACDRPGPNRYWAILLEVLSLTASPGYSLAGECPEETKQLYGKECLKRENIWLIVKGLCCFSGVGLHTVLV